MRTALTVIIGISIMDGTATLLAYPMVSIGMVRLRPSADIWLLDGASE